MTSKEREKSDAVTSLGSLGHKGGVQREEEEVIGKRRGVALGGIRKLAVSDSQMKQDFQLVDLLERDF